MQKKGLICSLSVHTEPTVHSYRLQGYEFVYDAASYVTGTLRINQHKQQRFQLSMLVPLGPEQRNVVFYGPLTHYSLQSWCKPFFLEVNVHQSNLMSDQREFSHLMVWVSRELMLKEIRLHPYPLMSHIKH